MRFLSAASKFAFVGGMQTAGPRSLMHPTTTMAKTTCSSTFFPVISSAMETSSSRLFSSRGSDQDVQLRNIGKEEMEEILEDYEEGGREESGYLVMDVREMNEVAFTGKLSPNTQTLPLSIIGQQNIFSLDDDEFEEIAGFPKPTPGIRSVHAAQFAAMNGYTNLVNYKGGANEWFM